MAIVNLIRYSGDPTNGAYNGSNGWAYANLGTTVWSPNNVCFRAIYTGANGLICQAGIPEYQANTQFTTTFWIKPETWNKVVQLALVDSQGNNGVITYFDPANPDAAVTSAAVQHISPYAPWSSPTCTVDHLENGWFAVHLSGVTGSTPNLTLAVFLFEFDTTLAVGTSLLWGGLSLYQGTETAFVLTTTAPAGNGFLPQFSFPNHRVGIRYLPNSTTIQMGGGYQFASKPTSPPQRIFSLNFDVMKWYVDRYGNLDLITDAANNVGALDAFYQSVQLYSTFSYPHPMYGPIACKFSKPLDIPPVNPGGTGAILKVVVELVEQL